MLQFKSSFLVLLSVNAELLNFLLFKATFMYLKTVLSCHSLLFF